MSLPVVDIVSLVIGSIGLITGVIASVKLSVSKKGHVSPHAPVFVITAPVVSSDAIFVAPMPVVPRVETSSQPASTMNTSSRSLLTQRINAATKDTGGDWRELYNERVARTK